MRPALVAARRTFSIGGGVALVRAVREVEAKDVDARRRSAREYGVSLADAGPSVAMIFVRRMWIRYANSVDPLQAWLEQSLQDADRRQLPALRPLLETLSRSTCVAARGGLESGGDRSGRARIGTCRVELRTVADLWPPLQSKDDHRGSTRPRAAWRASPSAIDRSTRTSPCSSTKRWRRRKSSTRRSQSGHYRGPLHGVPISLKDLIDRPRHADDGRVAGARGARCATRCDARWTPPRGWRDLRRQDEPSRVRARHDQRGLGLRSRPPSVRSTPDRRAARPADRPHRCWPEWRTHRSALTLADRSASRRRRAVSSA